MALAVGHAETVGVVFGVDCVPPPQSAMNKQQSNDRASTVLRVIRVPLSSRGPRAVWASTFKAPPGFKRISIRLRMDSLIQVNFSPDSRAPARVDDTWFRIDLLFFHRRLHCLVVIDLKVGKFSYADAGQMHLYLNYVREHWMKEGENPPVGLILCAEKGSAEAHYALDNLPNKVLAAEYQMVLPNEEIIADELKRSGMRLEERRMKRIQSEEPDS